MIKIVIDTNMFVSALNFGGTPSKALNLVNEGIIELIISPFILDELSKVLTRQFNWAEDKVKSAISAIKEI